MAENENDLVAMDEFEGELVKVARESSMSDSEIEEFYSTKTFRVIHQNNNFFVPQIKELIEGKEIIKTSGQSINSACAGRRHRSRSLSRVSFSTFLCLQYFFMKVTWHDMR